MGNKRIIICCDRDWDASSYRDDGIRQYPSNVQKLSTALDGVDPISGMQQVIFFVPGIDLSRFGTWLTQRTPGIHAAGPRRDIQDAYRFILENYHPGDEIYLFGAGHGANTAMSVADMLGAVGLLQKPDIGLIPVAYDYFRIPPRHRIHSREFKLIASLKRSFPRVHCLGLWEQLQGQAGSLARYETGLAPHVLHAYQAFALDEQRFLSTPCLWTELDGQVQCQQMWFSGSHSDLVGGSAEQGLSDIPLSWMVQRTRQLGLAYDASYLSDKANFHPDPAVKIHARPGLERGLASYLGRFMSRRRIGGVRDGNEMIHESVISRMLADRAYRPGNLYPQGDEMYPLVNYANHRNVIRIADREIPVFRERLSTRLALVDCPATVVDRHGVELGCEMLDYSEGGARLKAPELLSPGSEGILASHRFGRRPVTVVWAAGQQMGVRYAA